MQVLHQICAGMDIHKKDVKVCLVTVIGRGSARKRFAAFGRFLAQGQGGFALLHVSQQWQGVAEVDAPCRRRPSWESFLPAGGSDLSRDTLLPQ